MSSVYKEYFHINKKKMNYLLENRARDRSWGIHRRGNASGYRTCEKVSGLLGSQRNENQIKTSIPFFQLDWKDVKFRRGYWGRHSWCPWIIPPFGSLDWNRNCRWVWISVYKPRGRDEFHLFSTEQLRFWHQTFGAAPGVSGSVISGRCSYLRC